MGKDIKSKKCSTCGEEKELSEFSRAKNKKDGFSSQCKECVKNYYNKNKEKMAANQKTYYEANKEKIAKYMEAYSEANKEKRAKYHKAYREANREKINEIRRNNYKANKEKIGKQQKARRDKKKLEKDTK